MLTAMLAFENATIGTSHDVWSVNVDDDYHEEAKTTGATKGTGRIAPVLKIKK